MRASSYHIPIQSSVYEKLFVKVVIIIKSIFPKNENEIELVRFIGRFQYLSNKDVKYFFNDTYYPKRIAKLIRNNILRRYKKYLVLAENGQYFMKIIGQKASQLRYDKKYTDRLKFISHLAALYNKDTKISFTPSFEIKDKTAFTESSRKFIGILNIFGVKYLTYHISEEHTEKYIRAVIFDLQKETNYKNILILVNDIDRINLKDFAFGFNSVIISNDTDEELEKLKYINQVNWPQIIQKLYKNTVHISEYNSCDYTNNKDKYISTFYLLDAEKINRIKVFLQSNERKQADIVCSQEIVNLLGKELPLANYKLINISDFIEKDIKVYG